MKTSFNLMDWNFNFDDEMVEINCFNGIFNFLAFLFQNIQQFVFHEKQSTILHNNIEHFPTMLPMLLVTS